MGGLASSLPGLGGDDDAAEAAEEATAAQVKAQKQALAYLKQRERTPQRIRDRSLESLAGLYGVPGYSSRAPDLTEQVELDPRYMASVEQIDQALADEQQQAGLQASAGGFLRSGVLADALAKQRARSGVAKGQAFSNIYGDYLGGLQGLSQLPSYSPQIAGLTSDIGATRAQGLIGAAQSQQASNQAGFGNLMGLGQLAMQAYGTFGGGGSSFSDERLKENVTFLGMKGPYRLYQWSWNELGRSLGLIGSAVGVMAQEIQTYQPEAIGERKGYLTVNYEALEGF